MGRKSLTSGQKDKVFDKTLQRYTSKRQIFRLSSEVSEILDEVEDKSSYIRDAIVFYDTYKDQIKDERKTEESASEDSHTGTFVPAWKRS